METLGMLSLSEASSLMINRNPFWVLGATTRDTNHRIIELADERSLLLDDETCRQARSDLTTPRPRLAAEVAWLPGVSPTKAKQLVLALEGPILRVAEDTGLPTLARVNLMAAAFEREGGADGGDFARLRPDEAAAFILTFCALVDAVNPEEV